MKDENSIWTPHPGPQTKVLKRREYEILYGGARGGGKTDAGIVWLTYDVHHPKLRALILRRNSEDLRDWIDRANGLYSQLGAVKSGNPPELRWPGGALFRTGHLRDEQAYTKYQGHEYQRGLVEELTQIPTEKAYLSLMASFRSTVEDLDPQIFMTTNPGGLGHAWVKERFIDVAPWGKPYIYEVKLPTGEVLTRDRIFIHATLDDNPTLVKADPNYIVTLEQLKEVDEERYKAWRFGDWDVFAGQVFTEFKRDTHVIEPFVPKESYPHFLWIDWGYSGRDNDQGAFACYAASLIKVKYQGEDFNRVIVYKEWYDKYKNPDEWAEKVWLESPVKRYAYGVADRSMFNPGTDGSTPISDLMSRKWKELNRDKQWLTLKKGTSNRIGRVATLHNWLQIAPDGLPYLLISERCVHAIRTIPMLIYDEHRVEDVDTDGEDHPYDAITYGLSNIRFIPATIGGIGQKTKIKAEIPRYREKLDLSLFEKKGKVKKDWRI
jgi:hypothetical protein